MRVASNVLVLPMDRIVETARILPEEVASIKNKVRCVQRHGQVLPLLDLARLLKLSTKKAEDSQTILVITARGRKIALVVDDLIGVQQVVVKPIEGLDGMLEGFLGGALMGDGSVALVVDADAMAIDDGV